MQSGAGKLVIRRLVGRAESGYQLAAASHSWPGINGEIVSSRLRNARTSKGKGSRPGFRADIHYRYEIVGQPFSGDTIYFGYQPTEVYQLSNQWVQRFQEGDRVEVLYRPGMSRTSALLPGDIEACRKELRSSQVIRALLFTIAGLLTLAPVMALLYQRKRLGILQQLWG